MKETERLAQAIRRAEAKGEHPVSLSTGSNTGKGGELEANTVDSYYFEGVFGFAPWPDLAEGERAAELAFEEHQDEQPLKSYYQTKVGKNYVSRSSGDAPVTADALAERAGDATYRMSRSTPRRRPMTTQTNDQAVQEAVAAERTRVLKLFDLDATSKLSRGARAAIQNGTDAGDFAMELVQADKTRLS